MSNRSQQQAARTLVDSTPGLKYTAALRQVQDKQGDELGNSVTPLSRLEDSHAATEFLERLFAENNRTNKTLPNEYGHTRPSPSPVEAFLELGDTVAFYAGSKHQWTVMNQSENFTILIDGDFYTIIDWRNGWRGPHSSWGFRTTTDEKRVVALAALESGQLDLSIRRALYLDIKTVRRNGALTIRRARKSAENTQP